MKVALIMAGLRALYIFGGRDLLLLYVTDTENPYDDKVIAALDAYLGYSEPEEDLDRLI